MNALTQGAVDATVLAPPANLAARNLGFDILTSLMQAGERLLRHRIGSQGLCGKEPGDCRSLFEKIRKRDRVYQKKSLRAWTHWQNGPA